MLLPVSSILFLYKNNFLIYNLFNRMKECCKTGDETPPKNKIKRYFNIAIYTVIAGIILFVIVKSL